MDKSPVATGKRVYSRAFRLAVSPSRRRPPDRRISRARRPGASGGRARPAFATDASGVGAAIRSRLECTRARRRKVGEQGRPASPATAKRPVTIGGDAREREREAKDVSGPVRRLLGEAPAAAKGEHAEISRPEAASFGPDSSVFVGRSSLPGLCHPAFVIRSLSSGLSHSALARSTMTRPRPRRTR